eukprot:TRINITY_DN11189_c0_g1_i1.p1 TRINITY_DN11189_c0_g1~~TRINITY_DN11189_c0_g1_i1.p1  ORF type:complete len:102 (+),score=24.92 TRINITY_DN11189_c0_g1_i1:34-339(+)
MCETPIKPSKVKKQATKRKKKRYTGPNLEHDDSENSVREDFDDYYEDVDYDPMKDRTGSTFSNEGDNTDLVPLVEENDDDLEDIIGGVGGDRGSRGCDYTC